LQISKFSVGDFGSNRQAISAETEGPFRSRPALARRRFERGSNSEIHRLWGELTGRLPYPDPAKVERSFRTALAIAREQGTRRYELRAAVSLARLWLKQGRQGEVRAARAGPRLVHRGLRHCRPERSEGSARRTGMSRRLFGFGRRGGEHSAETARRLGESRVDMIRQVLVVRMDRVIAQNGQIDPEWVVVDDPVPECRAKACPRRGADGVVLLFEIRFEEFPAQLERDLKALDRRIPYNRVFRQCESLIQPGDGAFEIRQQRLRFGRRGTRCCASLRKFSGARLKSTTSIV
jgi:hypothetical protein